MFMNPKQRGIQKFGVWIRIGPDSWCQLGGSPKEGTFKGKKFGCFHCEWIPLRSIISQY